MILLPPDVALVGHSSQETDARLSEGFSLITSISNKNEENPFIFDISIPKLASGIATTVETCAAAAVLLASQGCRSEVRMFAAERGFIGSLNIPVRWNLHIGDLTHQIKTKLAESLQDTGDGPSFLIAITADQAGSGTTLLDCHAQDGRITVRAVNYDSSETALSLHFLRQYEYIVSEMCLPQSVDKPLVDLKAIAIQDLQQVWTWNSRVPARVDLCIHKAFMRRARQHPAFAAVSAHDGELTYGELDDLSTRLAHALIDGGVQAGSIVLICIEKSMWVPVAQLAVMKCGCASTVLDTSLPQQRQRSIAELVQAEAVLTSPQCEEQAEALGLDCIRFTLDSSSSERWPDAQPDSLPKVRSSAWLYIVFTSGSTGTPKGAIISHANYASAVAHQQNGLDFREFDRVFDFASYAFDAAWCNVIHALMVGGCLCIPSDEERKGDLAGALRKYQVTYAVLTPSVAWFRASELPASLRTFHFGGEPLKAALVKELSTQATVINAYGPAECSTVSTAIVADPDGNDDPTIGTGLGACTWVVKLDGTDLVPIGEVGELWVEGPIVGQGYLRNPEKTTTTFVENPPWLLRGCPGLSGMKGHDGRQGCLYRTGDLVRYRPDGNLEFVGRKDSQVKIRGQRVELGEIEYNLQRALTDEARAHNVQIIAEVIKPEGSDVPTLVSFLFMAVSSGLSSADAGPILQRALEVIEDRLEKLVPPYMVPSAFFAMKEVPMTPTGKVDRRGLREGGKTLYWQHLNKNPSSTPEQEEESEVESKIRGVWSVVLNLPLSKIGLDVKFTRLGGDSITAMQVVSRCRSHNISIKVADILRLQTVRQVARSSRPIQQKVNRHIVSADEGNGWPLTPIQQIFFDNNPNGMNHYTLSYIVKLVRHTTHEELLGALMALTTRHGMLRARFRKRPEESNWEQYIAPAGPSSFLLQQHDYVDRATMQRVVDERQAGMDLVNGPVFAVDVFNSPHEAQTLLMSAHHVMMDLVSWRIVWHELSQYLSGTKDIPPPALSFQEWCRLQRDEGETLDPATVLPFDVTPANFEYWGVTRGEVFFRDSILNISVIDAEATALLLGASNDSLRTDILDILVGTLIFCFARVFPDRKPPPVFLEGHGREHVAGMDDFDLSEIIGWFTSVHPIEIGSAMDSSIFDLIAMAKDIRNRVPGKGRPYFASRFYSAAGRKAFEGHQHVELIFNYRGLFQQLEDDHSIFKLEDRQDRNLFIPGDGPDYLRPSLIDMNLVVQEGELQVWTRSHRHMRDHDAVLRWMDLYAKNLNSVAHELASLSPRFTLADFQLLDISYAGLETLLKDQLESEGIQNSDIRDIYPCTPMQEGILISSNIGAASYHSAVIWQATSTGSAVSIPRMAAAWGRIASMHPVFSTVFSTNPETGRFVQVVLGSPNEASICEAADSKSAVEQLQQMQSPQASPSQPQCFFTLCVDQEGEVACRLDITHALMDALSLPVIVQDLERAYSGRALSPCTPLRDYIEHIHRTPASNRLSYWKKYLAGVNPCDMPGDLVSPHSSQRNSQYGWITLPSAVTAPIAKICQDKGMTRSAFLHLAWSLVLSRFTGMRQVCFGYISSGRDAAVDGIENIVGPLINMLIARVDLQQPAFRVMDSINKYTIEHLETQHVSLAEVQHEISSNRLFNTNITVREARGGAGAADRGMHLVEISEEDPHEYDMVLAATLNKNDTEVSIQYRTDFASLPHAQEIQTALQKAIEFLESVAQDTPAAAESDPRFCDSLYDAYFYHTVGTDEGSAITQWIALFDGMDAACHFPPPLPSATHRPCANASASYTIQDMQWRNDCDATTQLFASWALLQTSYGNSADILVGTRGSTGGATPMPRRIHVALNQSVSSYLNSVQSIIATCSKLPPLSIHRLRALSAELALACDFQTVLEVGGDSVQGDGQITDGDSHEGRALSIQFAVRASGAQVKAKFDEQLISTEQVKRLFCQLEGVLRQMGSSVHSTLPLAEIDTISAEDLRAITVWNGTPFENVQGLVHDLISDTVRAIPDSPAISSWDGELTYRQLDLLSTRLAHWLIQLGVGPEVIVPLYFEKSMWMPVSAVAVLKAGGAGVMIDCTQPIERACSIVDQVHAKFVITLPNNVERASQFEGLQLLVVDQASVDALPDPEGGLSLPNPVLPSNLVYVSFTSGSTGKPKGAMITHSCFTSAIRNQQRAHGFGPGQRVYDFASYAFDVSWSNLLHSLTSGSCLCIPSEYQRSNALSDSIRDSKATLINATPSILRHLDPKDLPDLEQILMGGEAWSEADFGDWIDSKKLMNSYGPGESTVKACIIRAARGMVPNTIGRGIGLHTWIVRTDGSDRLAPLGSVGELWLEGPQVALGYIGDEAKTAAAFVTRSKWTVPGQQCRFYRTGDLVRYQPDGDLVFVGRRDSQVKIRGQRTELGEIEYGIRRALLAGDLPAQIVADVFKPHNSENHVLVAFIKADEGETDPWRKLMGLDERLAKLVPEYMIPTAYIHVQQFPMTATGKVHRRSLREIYAKKTLEQLVALDALRVSGQRAPSTASEKILRDLWVEILNIDPDAISADDSFFRIGGDSLGAMRLVGAARKAGLALSVAEIFMHPKLSALAKVLEVQKPTLHQADYSVEPFCLLDRQALPEDPQSHVAHLCGLEPDDIEDVFPCTPLQAGLLAETVRCPGDNILTESWALRDDVDVSRLRAAWQKVVCAHPILRTRIVDLGQQGLVQVIIRYESCETPGLSAQDFGLGTPLIIYEISESHFLLSIHHALYDGWSMPLVFDALLRSYQFKSIQDAPPFQAFIRYATQCSQTEAEEFWRDQFRDCDAQNFPVLPSKAYRPRCDEHFEVEIKDVILDGDYTAATNIRLAWAILLSTVTNSADASFGATVSGRQADVSGIENMTGPTIATVPLRVAVDRSKTVRELLQQVQLQAAEMMPFEQVGIQRIRRLSEECNLGCEFQSLMVIQHESSHDVKGALFKTDVAPFEAGDVNHFKLYAICLEFVLKPNSICFRADYDSTVVSQSRFHRLASRFENVLRQLSSPDVWDKPVFQLDTSSQADLHQIWSWNRAVPERSDQTVHGIFGQVAARQPRAPAICAWDGDFTYGQVDEMSTCIAKELLGAGLPQSGQRIVPLFFEKSKWMPVCQIAVMKASGTSVALDTTLPDGRLQTVMDLVQPQIILASAEQEYRARDLAPTARVIVVSDMRKPTSNLLEYPHLPIVDPDTWLYVVFTSGSTGTPKGAIISHSNFTSALKYGKTALNFGPETRAYDFVSYAFDVSWLNVLYTLCAGGCLCVPSHYEIQNEPREAIARRQANTAFITPTVGKLLRGADLKILNYGGENLPRDEINHWRDRAEIIHSYGPSECTPIAISHILDPARSPVIIGKALGARSWIVEPEHGKSLAAVGDVGELWIEGPIVGQGYLNDPQRTAASFVQNPEWLTQSCPGFVGRHGRMYRTGDLVRYEEDGNLQFIGRKDAQIKIRGQRVELEEIEHHIHDVVGHTAASQVVVDIIKLADTGPALVAFIKLSDKRVVAGSPEAQSYARQLAVTVKPRLLASIPRYMIPNAYTVVDSIPNTTSGKVDRGKLRQAASAMAKADLLQAESVARRAPETPEETKLHALVAHVLSWDGESFGMDNNFMQLGGDSISAMRLASLSRKAGIFLTVTDILTKDRIVDLLVTTQQARPEEASEHPRFTLLDVPDAQTFVEEEVMAQIEPGCGGQLVDVLPATDMQSTYLRNNLHSPRRSWLYSYIDFAQIPEEGRLVHSLEKLVEVCEIYRTAFVRSGDAFFQAVFDSWKPTIDIVHGVECVESAFYEYVAEDVKAPASLGAPLVQFKLIRGQNATSKLVFDMSHAVYDAISMDQTLQTLADVYKGIGSNRAIKGFHSYVHHINSSKQNSYAYWRKTLQNSSMTIVPCTSSAPALDGPPTVLIRSVPLPKPPAGITQATLFTLACASTLSRLTNSTDVVFGRVVSGRATLPTALQNVIGPCLNRLPVRVQFTRPQTKTERLIALQKQQAESLAYETTGLSEIARNCTDWPYDTREFGCWIQYQNVDEEPVLALPGAVGGLRSRPMWEIPVAADFLEVFAVPSREGMLTVKLISGPGYANDVMTEFLEGVCAELEDTSGEVEITMGLE
ncbi:uncharacterized protein CDV56_109100 [Aspergillus thermomutatus]|uniref:Carrier domain-containing protein n=1 Tax=Aspergillus thermomutatus TaxID=41047 RepID=A0A397HVW2_ASPTH|nr:uncharacterized protein CDV56_109100 [Aspergillus thermomutatus]RHZ67355.1 hypothetical protein CDV56_109100 [Aspergillus thermomutatus]